MFVNKQLLAYFFVESVRNTCTNATIEKKSGKTTRRMYIAYKLRNIRVKLGRNKGIKCVRRHFAVFFL